MDIQKIFENNNEWVKSKLALDSKYFRKLAKGQNPEILYIGCSDSRVTAEELMGLQPGDVFVHRNIANMVPNTDFSVLSVINYAVLHLNVNHIVVCGHYNCGGVKAAMESNDLGLLNSWLRNIRDVYRLHQDEFRGVTDEEQKYKMLVELNVKEQCINVIKTVGVQRAFEERGMKVHGWVFDIHSGRLVDLKIDFNEVIKSLYDIYHQK